MCLTVLLIDYPWAAYMKCQPGKYMDWTMVRKILKNVGAQQLTVYPFFLWLGADAVRARLSFAPELPSAKETLLSLVFFALCAEVYFYHCHRLLHHPLLYPHVHKVHHEFTYPIALECIYFHPVESVLNFGVVASGPLILGSHVTLLYLFTVIGVANVLIHHCGHEVPLDSFGLGSMTHQHDFHHKVFNRNFGVIGICDTLYGTRAPYDSYHERWEKARQAQKAS